MLRMRVRELPVSVLQLETREALDLSGPPQSLNQNAGWVVGEEVVRVSLASALLLDATTGVSLLADVGFLMGRQPRQRHGSCPTAAAGEGSDDCRCHSRHPYPRGNPQHATTTEE